MSYSLLRADALHLPLADGSVHLIVTSPPYFGQRSYVDGGVHYNGQIGSEASPAEFLQALFAAMKECWRVLAPGGSVWVNLGDKRAGSGSPGTTSGLSPTGRVQGHRAGLAGAYTQEWFGRRKGKQLLALTAYTWPRCGCSLTAVHEHPTGSDASVEATHRHFHHQEQLTPKHRQALGRPARKRRQLIALAAQPLGPMEVEATYGRRTPRAGEPLTTERTMAGVAVILDKHVPPGQPWLLQAAHLRAAAAQLGITLHPWQESAAAEALRALESRRGPERYFGQRPPHRAGHCGNCGAELPHPDATYCPTCHASDHDE